MPVTATKVVEERVLLLKSQETTWFSGSPERKAMSPKIPVSPPLDVIVLDKFFASGRSDQ